MFRIVIIGFVVGFLGASSLGGRVCIAQPIIQTLKDKDQKVIAVRASGGWVADWLEENESGDSSRDFLAKRFFVRLSKRNTNVDPAMLGRIQVKGKALEFRPRFDFVPGVPYTATLRNRANDGTTKTLEFMIPKSITAAPKVEEVYPSSQTLPENLLRFYVVFSTPMEQGDIYKFLSIRNEKGEAIELPFLELEQELWSRDGKRITLLLDPGRIKRGLKPRKDMGPILVAGKKYELVVSGNWRDANGNSLGDNFTKSFVAGKAIESRLRPSSWKLESPKAGTRNAVALVFGHSLDFGMLNRVVAVSSKDGSRIAGKIELSQGETRWSFKPEQNWSRGKYRIEIDNRLEDVCGNSIEKEFDVDVFNKTQPVRSGKTTIPFTVK